MIGKNARKLQINIKYIYSELNDVNAGLYPYYKQ